MRIADIKEIGNVIAGLLDKENYKLEQHVHKVLISAKAPEEQQKRGHNMDRSPMYDPIASIEYNSLYNGLIIKEAELEKHGYETEIQFRKEQRKAMHKMAEELESIVNYLPEGVTYVNNILITVNED